MVIQKIDELNLQDHWYLDSNDDCYYFGEYTPGKGYSGSPTNQLIFNFKKSPIHKNKPHWVYKVNAINTIVELFEGNLSVPKTMFTLVPIPPSKCKTDPEYDDRMMDVLKLFNKRNDYDVQELFELDNNMNTTHKQEGHRPDPKMIRTLYNLDENVLKGTNENIVLFDDLITTGSHFKGLKNKILKLYPDKNVYGIFIARRAIPKDE